MTKDELRKQIADKILEWISSGELGKAFDNEELPVDTIGVTIEVNGIDRKDLRPHSQTIFAMKASIAKRTGQ